MCPGESGSKRRVFRWSQEARQLVINYQRQPAKLVRFNSSPRKELIAKLMEISGYPREACRRFLLRQGLMEKRNYREWTTREQQKLVALIEDLPVQEAARILCRPPGSVRSMLHRLGLGSRQSREWFTVSLLARALHIGREEVRRWVERGWLKSRVVHTQSVNIQIVEADEFCAFIKNHGREAVSGRVSYEGLEFVRDYVFPRPHADLFSLRGTYKKQAKRAPPTTAEATVNRDIIKRNPGDRNA